MKTPIILWLVATFAATLGMFVELGRVLNPLISISNEDTEAFWLLMNCVSILMWIGAVYLCWLAALMFRGQLAPALPSFVTHAFKSAPRVTMTRYAVLFVIVAAALAFFPFDARWKLNKSIEIAASIRSLMKAPKAPDR